jgi:hypothetical protein
MDCLNGKCKDRRCKILLNRLNQLEESTNREINLTNGEIRDIKKSINSILDIMMDLNKKLIEIEKCFIIDNM